MAKQINGFENYTIKSNGVVLNKHGKEMKLQQMGVSNYDHVFLRKSGKYYLRSVRKLIKTHFDEQID